MKINKIINGGIYLVDLSGYISPEFGFDHYCILFRTNRTELYLAFPITTSEKRAREKYTILNPIDQEGYILLNQVRPISKNRIKAAKIRNGMVVFSTGEQSNLLFDAYLEYLSDLKTTTNISINQITRNKEEAKSKMVLECVKEIEIQQNDKINYGKLVLKAKGGKMTHTIISTKSPGVKFIDFFLTNSFGHKINQKVKVIVK